MGAYAGVICYVQSSSSMTITFATTSDAPAPASKDHTVRLWDPVDAVCIASIPVLDPATSVAFAPDGRLAIAWSSKIAVLTPHPDHPDLA